MQGGESRGESRGESTQQLRSLRGLPQSEMEVNKAPELLCEQRNQLAWFRGLRRSRGGSQLPPHQPPPPAWSCVGHPPRGQRCSGASQPYLLPPGPQREAGTGRQSFGGGSLQLHPVEEAPWGQPLSFLSLGRWQHPPCHLPVCALCRDRNGACQGLPETEGCAHEELFSVLQAIRSPRTPSSGAEMQCGAQRTGWRLCVCGSLEWPWGPVRNCVLGSGGGQLAELCSPGASPPHPNPSPPPPAPVGAFPGAGNIWGHSHNRVLPTAAAAGPEPLSSATVCFAASLAPIEAFQLRPLQGV